MPQTNSNKPVDTIRYGRLKGTIWGNPGKDGKPPIYNVTITRSYTTAEGQWRETSSLGENDLLKLGHLNPKLIDRIAQLKAADRDVSEDENADEEGEA